LSVIVSVPVLVPTTAGVNVMLMEQLADVGKVVPQVVFSANGPVIAMLVIVRDAVPVLLSVTVCAGLVTPGDSEGNVKLVGERVTAGAAVAPPTRVTAWGLLAALSVMTNDPERVPGAVGVNVTLIRQPCPAAREAPQGLEETVKSPMVVILAMFNAAPPELVKVTVCGALVVPTGSDPNVRLVAESVTLGSKMPLPDKGKLWGELEALSTRLTDARRAPAAVGVKVTANAQPAPAARVAGPWGQVFCETAKSELFSPVTVGPGLVIVSGAPPEFVSITDRGLLVVFTGWSAKVRLAGARATVGAAAPIPARGTVCGLFAALSVRVKVP
jgi:hypothetical protein